MECKYCGTQMKYQGRDRIEKEYIGLFCCPNAECKALYEEYADLKGTPLYLKDRWWNPEKKDFEK